MQQREYACEHRARSYDRNAELRAKNSGGHSMSTRRCCPSFVYNPSRVCATPFAPAPPGVVEVPPPPPLPSEYVTLVVVGAVPV
jgi:hypothetical protein